jgi:predicted acyltransferase
MTQRGTIQHLSEATSPQSNLRVRTRDDTCQRLASLDAFRGMTVASLILVNNPGSREAVYEPLRHAPWNGWTPADLIFPFFLFIVGVSVVFSNAARRGQAQTTSHLVRHILLRAAALFAIGLIINALWPDGSGMPVFRIQTLRIPGVLQRIAVCYMFGSLIVLFTGWRSRLLVIASFLIGYWALLELVPVPGFGAGNLSPQGNLTQFIDRKILGNHVASWESEGILSTFTATTTTLFGTLAGEWLKAQRTPHEKVWGLAAFGAIGIGAGLLLDSILPINKPIYTSSFAVFTAGFAGLGLGAVYWAADVKRWRGWTLPFLVTGRNALAAFVLSFFAQELLLTFYTQTADGSRLSWQEYVYRQVFQPLTSPINASLFYALAFDMACFTVLLLMYKNRI